MVCMNDSIKLNLSLVNNGFQKYSVIKSIYARSGNKMCLETPHAVVIGVPRSEAIKTMHEIRDAYFD